MRVIGLLNKIANGKAPKTILYENKTYWYDGRENNYYTYIARDLDDEDIEYLFWGDNILDMLKDEIVIIEEYEKIERLQWCNVRGDSTKAQLLELKENAILQYDKINELINYLNKGE